MRQDFKLGTEDTEYLRSLDLTWELIVEGGQRWLLIHQFPVPNGYTVETSALAIRIEAGYPDAQLDMCYFAPTICRSNGMAIGATDVMQVIDGKSFQRWSRHRTTANPWRPGIDSVATHVGCINEWLLLELEK